MHGPLFKDFLTLLILSCFFSFFTCFFFSLYFSLSSFRKVCCFLAFQSSFSPTVHLRDRVAHEYLCAMPCATCKIRNGGTLMCKFQQHLQDEVLGIFVCNLQDGVYGEYLFYLFLLLDMCKMF